MAFYSQIQHVLKKKSQPLGFKRASHCFVGTTVKPICSEKAFGTVQNRPEGFPLPQLVQTHKGRRDGRGDGRRDGRVHMTVSKLLAYTLPENTISSKEYYTVPALAKSEAGGWCKQFYRTSGGPHGDRNWPHGAGMGHGAITGRRAWCPARPGP